MSPAPSISDRPAQLASEDGVDWIDEATLCLGYIPDFRVDDLVYYLVPSRAEAREAYQSLPARGLERWSGYFTKKGWRFIHRPPPSGNGCEGPFKVRPGRTRIEILKPGRIFSPRPALRLGPEAREVPLVGLEKRRPFDPWKPNYIKSIGFLKRYEPPAELTLAVQCCLYEIEESSEVPGSTGWENGERILLEEAARSVATRTILRDLFERRPEEYALASQVYLRVLGRSGEEGFRALCDLHSTPQHLKRCHVARALGELGDAKGLEVLLQLFDDENPEVANAAVEAMGRAGVASGHPAEARLRKLLESGSPAQRVWAMEGLLRGGEKEQEKGLIQLVKESPLTLLDMGDLGRILIDLQLVHAVPFLIKRLKSERFELRDDAAEALRGLTGIDPGFHGHDDHEKRRAAIRQWEHWWEDYKRTRAAGRSFEE